MSANMIQVICTSFDFNITRKHNKRYQMSFQQFLFDDFMQTAYTRELQVFLMLLFYYHGLHSVLFSAFTITKPSASRLFSTWHRNAISSELNVILTVSCLMIWCKQFSWGNYCDFYAFSLFRMFPFSVSNMITSILIWSLIFKHDR